MTADLQVARKWKRYSAYKDSGAEWLAQIPENWEVKRLKRLFRVVNGSTPKSSEPDYWDGDIPWVTPDDLGELSEPELSRPARYITKKGYENCGTTLVPKGSLLLSTRAPIGHLAIAGISICTNQGCRSLVLRGQQNGRYYYYQLLAARPELESLGDGSTFKELAKESLESTLMLQPSRGEQIEVTVFLDRQTAKIDVLLAKKGRLIELLQEKRASLITHAVTKSLDPTVPMKDSGVEWLGQIPAHWKVKPLMRLTPANRPIMYGIVLPGPNVDGGVPIVKGGDVAPGRLRLDLLNRTTREIEASYARSRLRAGDLVYAIRGSIGMVEVVPAEVEGANLTQDAARVAPRTGVDNRWLLFALKAHSVFGQLEAGSMGAAVKGINIRDLKRAILPVPPHEDQVKLASFLDRETAKIDALIAKVRDGIEKLREYRTALISAAVTGKIDVREEAMSASVSG